MFEQEISHKLTELKMLLNLVEKVTQRLDEDHPQIAYLEEARGLMITDVELFEEIIVGLLLVENKYKQLAENGIKHSNRMLEIMKEIDEDED